MMSAAPRVRGMERQLGNRPRERHKFNWAAGRMYGPVTLHRGLR